MQMSVHFLNDLKAGASEWVDAAPIRVRFRMPAASSQAAPMPWPWRVFLDSGNLGCYNADTLAEMGKGAEGE